MSDTEKQGSADKKRRIRGPAPPGRAGSAASEVGERFADGVRAFGGWIRRDTLSFGLLIASIALAIAFFVLLGDLEPPKRRDQVPLSEVTKLTKDRDVESATLLDEYSQVIVHTKDGRTEYANYPGSDAETSQLVTDLTRSGATVTIDPQSSVPAKQITVQFLIPILLLVC